LKEFGAGHSSWFTLAGWPSTRTPHNRKRHFKKDLYERRFHAW
jgi:hypothetical protein